MREIRVVAERVVAGTPAEVWPHVSDSERINRFAGLPPLRFQDFASEDSAARLLGHVTLLGRTVSFEEEPTVFEVERFAEWRRTSSRGPIRTLVIRAEIEPVTDTTTRVRGVITCAPRWAWLATPLRWSFGVGVRDLAAALARLVEGAQPPSTLPVAATLAAAADRLRARTDAPCADAIVEHVAHAEDAVVQRIRPFALADSLALPRREMLSTCVAAAEVGLLDLSWVLVCPSCRNGTEVLPTLQDLATDEGRCHACELRFSLDMDRSVEVVFAPHAAVRKPDTATYCSGGPARTPHVVAQVNVGPGAEGMLHAPREAGHYRLVARGGGAVPVDVVVEAPAAMEVTLGIEAGPERVEVAPGGSLRARHGLSYPVHVKLEHLDRPDDAVTARDLGMLPAFRRRYATETLRPGLSLKVGRVALLFSDLAESTRLYGDMGDSTAFRIVHDHFAVLEGPITARGGTVVKTIGDAIMAVFPDETAAVAAGVDILAAFGPFRAAGEGRARTDIKLGVYAGPCYVVTANGILDYFGQTVNTAARLQGVAGAGELVIEAHLGGGAAALGATVGEPFPAALKGVRERVEVLRVRWPSPLAVSTMEP